MNKIFFLSIVPMVILSSCGSKHNAASKQQSSEVVVNVNQVKNIMMNSTLTASGKIQPENSANISTRIMGYVMKIHAKIGQNVKQGQLLVSINSSDLQAKLAQVESSISQAQVGYMSAKKDYERFYNLFNQKSTTQKELDDMTTRMEIAKASLEAAKQMKQEVAAQFAYTNIKAPFSGIITGQIAKEGDIASPGMPILTMEGTNRLQAVAMVSESNITAIKQGSNVEVLIKALNKKTAGEVAEISKSALNTGGQYIVKINLPKLAPSVLSGMFVNVEFLNTTKIVNASNSEIMIPKEALVRQGQLLGVYTVGQNKTALLRWLRIGKTMGTQVEVLSGLSIGESYISHAEGKLFNGAKLKIQ